jgi:protein tyrosine/serine phosphatase
LPSKLVQTSPSMIGPAWLKARTALSRTLKAGTVALGLVAGSIGAYWGALQYEGNFHAVEEGAFYRSAQLTKGELQQAVRDHGIKAVLNLRGAHPGEAWYDDEVAVSNALGVKHYDYGLSAHRRVTEKQIDDLLAIVRDAPKPLLVHCKSGADRAGLVSALYQFAVEGKSRDEADAQLTLLYGHFPYLTSRTRAMDDSFWAFVNEPRGHAGTSAR